MKIHEAFAPAPAGHNNPPDTFETLQDRTSDLIANANRWLDERPEIETQDQADKCKDFLDQLRAEHKAVEKERKAEKQPHLDAGAAVDSQYSPLKAMLETAGKLLNPIMTAWLQKQQAIQDEIARKADEEAAAKIQAEAEALASDGNTVEAAIHAEQATKEADDAALVAERAKKVRAGTKGQHGGRATTLRTVKTIEITGLALLFQHFSHREEVHSVLQRLAAAEIRAGNEVPGIKIIETQKAV